MVKRAKAPPHTVTKAARLQTRPRFMHVGEFELSPSDAERFSAELRHEFPTIRFLNRDYFEHWMEREFSDKPVPGFSPNYREIVSERMRPPHGEPMPYAYSFRDMPHDVHMAWLEPPGWKPQWSAKPYRRGKYVLLNAPEHHFIYYPAQYSLFEPSGNSHVVREPPTAFAAGELCTLYGGFMNGPYFPGDDAQVSFLKRVLRIARRITSNKIVAVENGTLKISPRCAPRSMRVGHDAIEWTRRDRRYLIGTTSEYLFRAIDAFSD